MDEDDDCEDVDDEDDSIHADNQMRREVLVIMVYYDSLDNDNSFDNGQ